MIKYLSFISFFFLKGSFHLKEPKGICIYKIINIQDLWEIAEQISHMWRLIIEDEGLILPTEYRGCRNWMIFSSANLWLCRSLMKMAGLPSYLLSPNQFHMLFNWFFFGLPRINLFLFFLFYQLSHSLWDQRCTSQLIC